MLSLLALAILFLIFRSPIGIAVLVFAFASAFR